MITLNNITLEKFCSRIDQKNLKVSLEDIPKNPTLYDDASYFKLYPDVMRKQIEQSYNLDEFDSCGRFMFMDSFKDYLVNFYDEVNHIIYLELERGEKSDEFF